MPTSCDSQGTKRMKKRIPPPNSTPPHPQSPIYFTRSFSKVKHFSFFFLPEGKAAVDVATDVPAVEAAPLRV